MDTKEKIELANDILSNSQVSDIKKLKKDKSLIERRTSECKIILTEDNRELLRD